MVVSPRRLSRFSRERLERAPRGETKIKGGRKKKEEEEERMEEREERRKKRGKKKEGGTARGRAFQHVPRTRTSLKHEAPDIL